VNLFKEEIGPNVFLGFFTCQLTSDVFLYEHSCSMELGSLLHFLY